MERVPAASRERGSGMALSGIHPETSLAGEAHSPERRRSVHLRLFVAGALAAALAGPALAAPAAAQLPSGRLVLDSTTSRVWFDGTSTFGSFTATTASLAGWTELAGPRQVENARGEVDVRAATLKTGIGLRDRHLRQELDTDHFPLVTLIVDGVTRAPAAAPVAAAIAGARAEALPAAADATPVVLHGSLTVKGQAHPVALAATAAFRGDTLVVVGRAPLRFTELGMKPPTKLFGAARVHDEFVLRFDGRFLPIRP